MEGDVFNSDTAALLEAQKIVADRGNIPKALKY